MTSSPLTEINPNVARKSSRSSQLTASLKDGMSSSLIKGDADMGSSTSGNAAVLSMLKTTTETGDLGSFSMGSNRLPKLPRGLTRLPPNGSNSLAHSSSRASSRYSRNGSVHESIRSGKSHRSGREGSIPGAWPYGHTQYASSMEFPRPPSEARSSAAPGSLRSVMISGHDPERSYSLTRTLPYTRAFGDNRSVSSFRSQEPSPRPESPFVQANRLQYSRNRPSSPARSDTGGVTHQRRQVVRQRMGLRAHTAMALPPQLASDFSRAPNSRFAAYPPPTPRFRPSRTIEDLRRPFIAGGQSNDFRPIDRDIPYRMPQSLPAQHRQADYGPPLPHARNFDARPPPNQFVNQESPSIFGSGPSDTTPYKGFVQRVKIALEERGSTEELRPLMPSYNHPLETPKPSTVQDSHEMTVGLATVTPELESEEPELPVDGQARQSKGPFPEIVDASPSVKRLTRDMIKAGMDGMSDVVAMSDVAEEGMATSILNVDDDEHGKSSSGESVSSMRPGSAINTAPQLNLEDADADAGMNAKGGSNSDSEITASPTSPSDPMSYSLRLSKSYHDVVPQPDARSGLLVVNGTLDISSGSRARFLTENSIPRGISNRYSDLPSGTMSQASYPPRSTMAKSMPLLRPGSRSEVVVNDHVNDQDEQIAIRLSSIDPASQAQGPTGAALDTTPSNRSSTHGMSHPSMGIASPGKLEEENLPGPMISLQDSTTLAVKQSDTTTSPVCGDAPDTTDAMISPSKRNATLFDASRSAISTPSRSSPHIVESRISAIKNFHSPMPDLTEDSQEDASTTNLRILGIRAPVSRSRAPKDFRRQHHMPMSPPAPVAEEPPQSYLKRTAFDLHHIPSFNFSRVDLTTKLNSALGLRFSRSAGDLTELTSSSVGESLPDRPMSQVMVRETYRSFFSATEETRDDDDDDDDAAAVTVDRSAVKSVQFDGELLNEIEKLSIPSVKHLTARLSELLPSIKHSRSELDLKMVDEALRQTVKEIRQVGSSDGPDENDADQKLVGGKILSPSLSRLGTVNSKATASSRHRVRRKSLLQLMKALPPLPVDHRQSHHEDASTTSAHSSAGSSAGACIPENVSELDGTAVEVTGSIEAIEPNEADAGKVQRNDSLTKRSHPSPGTTPRPWNKAESYPWSIGTQPVDITVSTDTMDGENRDEARAQAPRLPRPNVNPTPRDSMRIVRSMSPAFGADLIPGTDEPLLLIEQPGSSKHGLINAVARRMGRKPRIEKAGFAVDPLFFHPEEQTVGAGDRYPTTSLSSPAGMTVDEGRSYFSDDSSLSDHAQAGIRKRLTRLRPRLTLPNGGSPAASPANSQNELNRTCPSHEPSQDATRPAVHRSVVSANDQPAVGMSKTEFRAKRLVEKIRFLLFKGGERLRHMGKGKRREVWHNAEETQPINV